MEFEVFRHKGASDEQFEKIDDIFNVKSDAFPTWSWRCMNQPLDWQDGTGCVNDVMLLEMVRERTRLNEKIKELVLESPWAKAYPHLTSSHAGFAITCAHAQLMLLTRGRPAFLMPLASPLSRRYSLNTMYFFDRDADVDGCADLSEPGFKYMEWLSVQLHRLREREPSVKCFIQEELGDTFFSRATLCVGGIIMSWVSNINLASGMAYALSSSAPAAHTASPSTCGRSAPWPGCSLLSQILPERRQDLDG
ncbi:hypothetical protein FDECE_16041 [Fusarium decemcellulare]|nr:hypothetical protein FDECE_16041 [Fusarium decemcellulare]